MLGPTMAICLLSTRCLIVRGMWLRATRGLTLTTPLFTAGFRVDCQSFEKVDDQLHPPVDADLEYKDAEIDLTRSEHRIKLCSDTVAEATH